MCNFILDIMVRRPTRYVAPRSTQHDLSDLKRALLDVLGQRGLLGFSDIEETLDTEASTRTVQRKLKTLRELDLDLEDMAEERASTWPPGWARRNNDDIDDKDDRKDATSCAKGVRIGAGPFRNDAEG